MKIDFEGHRILLDNETIYLTKKQNAILELLYSSTNQLITYKDIAEKVYQTDYDIFLKNLIRKHISLLRKKIGKNIEIKTIREVGYIIEEDLKWV